MITKEYLRRVLRSKIDHDLKVRQERKDSAAAISDKIVVKELGHVVVSDVCPDDYVESDYERRVRLS